MSFLAKRDPNESYEEHVWAVYQAWKRLIECHDRAIKRICNRIGVDWDRFLLSSLLCVAFHDIGKLSANFQRIMRSLSRTEYQRALKDNFRHEYASTAFVFLGADSLEKMHGPLSGAVKKGIVEAMAVLGHHKTVDGELSRFERERRTPESLSWAEGGVEEGRRVAEKIYEDFGVCLPAIDYQRCCDLARKPPSFVMRLGDCVKDIEIARELFILMKGLLMVADWHASAHNRDYRLIVDVAPEKIGLYLREKGKQEGWTFSGFRDFQRACGRVDGHVVAIAPTGSGKTEAALLWALRQVELGRAGKILYLLPTMVTANSLYERIHRFFSVYNHSVGLTHSMADLMTRREQDKMDDELGDGEEDIRSRLLFDRHFIPPVTVGTIDQLLTTLFHAGRWPIKGFSARDAAIVLDEIHSYDPYTIGLIFKAIEELGSAGTRFMVMSATLPHFLERNMKEILGQSSHVEVVRDQELLQKSRSFYQIIDDDLVSHLDMIQDKISAGKKVLIVVNTVARCQELTKILEDFQPVCYHSKFIFKDRQKKEEFILNREPGLLIATQVVEVALDIDYDVLFTECAPPDALAQRAGRINRRRKRNGKVIIFRPGPGSERIYFDDTHSEQDEKQTLLNRSFDAFVSIGAGWLTEQDLLDLVENVYEGTDIQSHEGFILAQQVVDFDRKRLLGLLDPTRGDDEQRSTRLSQYEQKSVIPHIFEEEVMKLENPRDRRLYELKMPVWYIKGHSWNVEDGMFLFCEMEYDSHLGGRFTVDEALQMF